MNRTQRLGVGVYFLTLATLPFETLGFDTGVVVLSLPNVGIIVSTVLLCAAVFYSGELRLEQGQLYFLAAAVLYASFYLFRVVSTPAASTLRLPALVGNFLIVVTTAIAIQSRWHLKRALQAVTVGTVVFSLLTMISGAKLITPFAEINPSRIMDPLGLDGVRTLFASIGYGSFGVLVSITTAVLLWEIWRHTGRYRRLAAVSLLAVVVAVFVSESRSTYISVVAVLAVWIFQRVHLEGISAWKRWGTYTISLFGGVASLVLVGLLVSAAPWGVAARFELIQVGLDTFRSAPLWGVGPDGYLSKSGGVRIHNSFLGAFVTTGLIGGALFTAAWVVGATTAVRSLDSSTERMLPAVLIAALAGVFAENLLYLGVFEHPLWFLLACCASVRYEEFRP